jgi:site-specific DNA-methyltransferase (cytosine-N4-specific)
LELAIRAKQETFSTIGAWRLANASPYYETTLGAAYHGDALRLIKLVPDNSVNLIVTSPPFALHRKKEYGNVAPEDYVSWFSPFADEFSRVLANDGSLVIHIGGTWKEGEPSKSLYPYKLLLSLCEEKRFRLAQDFYWHNPAKLPAPAEWVNVRRIRVKDTVEFVWWFSKNAFPKADNNKIKKPYSESMKVLLKEGYKAKLRPSGHNISTKFSRDQGGAIPPNIFSISYGEDHEASNLFTISNTDSNGRYLRLCRELKIKPHPARYPDAIPNFFVKFLTDEGDKVLDPFGGSNVTGAVSEKLGRKWICFEIRDEYLKGSMLRFNDQEFISKPRFQ